MEQLIARCAGIDVGQAESVVCVRVPDADHRCPGGASLLPAGERLHGVAGQRRPHQARAGPQDGHDRRCPDNSAARSWAADRQLRTTPHRCASYLT